MLPTDAQTYQKYDGLDVLKSDDSMLDEIRHIKCPIIKLVRHQIESAELSLTDAFAICRRSWKYKLWNNRWTILKGKSVFLWSFASLRRYINWFSIVEDS
ncbi:hypothetical protein GWI33_017779 [Rhynchophorus ferrugineus]|uniref:Uncharacterized protein n=1 Tax=Rhynchophorus ferrugineus TaxID=354439 RepID=A0A834HXW7_RHYFE|nr:hypothetical protein GWI33_017779 [Rhynchophorus ferrugineus]